MLEIQLPFRHVRRSVVFDKKWVKNLVLKWKLLHHIWNVHDMRLTVFEKNYSSLKCTCFADYFFFKKRFNSLFDFFFMASTLSSSSHSAILASYNEKNFFNFLHLFYEIFSLFVLYVEKRGSSSPLPRKLWWISSKLFLLFFAPSKKISIWKHLKRIPFTPTFLLLRSVTRRAKKSVSVQRNSGEKSNLPGGDAVVWDCQ